MSTSLDAKRLRHLADVIEALEKADKPYLEPDPDDVQEEGLSLTVQVKWYSEPLATIEDPTGTGHYMVMFP